MKFKARDARRQIDRPDPAIAGFLLFGPGAGEVADARERLVRALMGDSDPLSLTRLDGTTARRDPASVSDAMRSVGFFGGRQVVLVEDATDGATEALAGALEDAEPAQAVLVASAGSLTAKSKLRKLFEDGRTLAALALYADPPDRGEIEDMLARAKAPRADREAMEALEALGAAMERGAFTGLLERIALYAGKAAELTAADVAACAPQSVEGDVDAITAMTARGDVRDLPAALSRLAGQGIAPTTVALRTSQHFRQLLALASAPEGPERAAQRMRPPLFGKRRDEMIGQARRLGVRRIETTLIALTDLELTLRSSSEAPGGAALERALMRVAMSAGRS